MAKAKANPFPKVFKAIGAFVSRDETRPMLAHVYADSETILVATDGHSLIRAVFDAPHGLTPGGFYDPKTTAGLLAAGMDPSIVPASLEPLQFPEWRRVIPAFTSEGSAVRVRGMNPALLSRSLDSLDSIARAYGERETAVRIQAAEGEGDPMRVDLRIPGAVRVTALIMPMRISADTFAPCAESAPDSSANAA